MTRRLSRITSLALAISAVAAPSASAQVDLRSPDARDAGDAGRPAVAVDLRSPDARDGGRREPAPVVVTAPPVVAADGFHWLDAGAGAAAVVALLILAGGVVVTRRRPLRAS